MKVYNHCSVNSKDKNVSFPQRKTIQIITFIATQTTVARYLLILSNDSCGLLYLVLCLLQLLPEDFF